MSQGKKHLIHITRKIHLLVLGILLVLGAAGLASTVVQGANVFVCQDIQYKEDGSPVNSVSCSVVGDDAIVWTFSDTSEMDKSINAYFGLNSSTPEDVVLIVDGTITRILTENAHTAEQWFTPRISVSDGLPEVMSLFGPMELEARLGGESAAYSHGPINYYFTTSPGNDKVLYMERENFNEGDTYTGTITIKKAEHPEHGSPFHCVVGKTGIGRKGSVQTDRIGIDAVRDQALFVGNPGWWSHELTDSEVAEFQYPGNVHCAYGSNYISWTAPVVRNQVEVYFGYDNGELYGKEGILEWSADVCNVIERWPSAPPVFSGSGYTTLEVEERIASLEAGECASLSGSESFIFDLTAQSTGLTYLGSEASSYLRFTDFSAKITVPSFPTPTPIWTATSDATATGTATATATETPTLTPSPTTTDDSSGGGGGGGDDGGGGGGTDPTTVPPTATKTYTRTPTPTHTATATATATASITPTGWTGTGTPLIWTTTPSLTPIVQTATLTFTPAVYSPTPDWEMTQTAMAWTPTPGSTSTPDYNATMTALAWTPTPNDGSSGGEGDATATASSDSGTGSGAGSSLAATATPSSGNTYSGYGYSGECAAYVRTLVYIDSNKDGIMALSGEGVDDISIYLVDQDYRLVSLRRSSNGVVKFCIPESLQGETLFIHAPYLIRSGSVKIPEKQQYDGFDVQEKAKTHEVIFKLDPPELPLYLP